METQIGLKPINRCALQVDCLVSMWCEIFHWGIFERSVIFSECISLALSKLFNCICFLMSSEMLLATL